MKIVSISTALILPAGVPQLYRVLHDPELRAKGIPTNRDRKPPEGNIYNVPEVYRLDPDHALPLDTPELQQFTFGLNPGMEPLRWRALFSFKTAFSNGDAGFDKPGGTPKPDFINGRDLNASGKLRLDQIRICGGALVAGDVGGDVLWLDYIDTALPLPNPANVPIWKKFCAVNIVNDHTWSRFSQRGGMDVWMGLMARQPISYPLNCLEKLDMSKPLPSPYSV